MGIVNYTYNRSTSGGSPPSLEENLLTNSGFDVWSNSTLEDVGSDLVTNGDFASASDWTISVASGTWAITGGVSRATAAAGAAQFFQARTYTVGKLYKVTWTVSGYSAGGIYIELSATTSQTVSANGTYSFVFEAADASDYINFRTVGTTTLDIDDVSMFEVTPGCVSGSAGPDGWAKRGPVNLYRQHNDATLTKDGSFYSLKVDGSVSTLWQAHWPTVALQTDPLHIARFAGRTVTFGAWVYSTLATPEVHLRIDDGGTSDSTQTVAQNTWTWLECTKTISTSVGPTFQIAKSGATAETFYVSQPTLCWGSSIGAGNYSRPMGEIVWFETAATLNNYNVADFSTGTATINSEAESNGKIPKGAKALRLTGYADDSSSTGGGYCQLELGYKSGEAVDIRLNLDEVPSGLWRDFGGWVRCDSNGDFYRSFNATGTNTLTVKAMVTGVELR
jgi:hypothetical protein